MRSSFNTTSGCAIKLRIAVLDMEEKAWKFKF